MTLTLLALVGACPATDDTGDTGTAPLDCTPGEVSPYPVTDGTWTALTETELYNECENAAGKGPHIHVGESNPLLFASDGDCLTLEANETIPVDLGGYQDGTGFEIKGKDEEEWGICLLEHTVTVTGEMVDATNFTYTFHHRIVPLTESECAVGVGDTENHTYAALPCELSWTGPASFGAE